MVGGCDGFSPTGDHELIKRLAREFAENEAAPTAAERDRERIWPAELVRKMGELGFMGIAVDESYGGAGMDSCFVCDCDRGAVASMLLWA